MKTFFIMLVFFNIVAVAENNTDCCKPKPKPRATTIRRVIVPQQKEPQQKQDQENEQEQDQNQHQTVNVHVHNQDNYRIAARLAAASRSRFKLGLHAGCGPVGVKRIEVSSNNYRYDLRNNLVVGASLSIRLLGPVWLTGQAFSNRLYTGGLEFEF